MNSTIRSLFLIPSFILLSFITIAQPNYSWSYAVGNYFASAQCVATDPQHNVIFSGRGYVNRATTIVKCTPGGTVSWEKTIEPRSSSNNSSITFTDIATDAQSNICAAGSFNRSFDFDPSGDSLFLSSNSNNSSATDAFVAKYDSAGGIVWAFRFGGSGTDIASAVAIDSDNNVYVCGFFEGTVDFDPGAGTANLNSSPNNYFIVKLSPAGNLIWAKNTSTNVSVIDYVAEEDRLLIGGMFANTADLDFGTGTVNKTAVAGYDAFFGMYDTLGNAQWVKSMGGLTKDEVRGFDYWPSKGILVCGSYSKSCNFNTSGGTDTLSHSGLTDMFYARYTLTGELVWVNGLGGPDFDYIQAISHDVHNNVWIGGYFGTASNLLDFDPGPDEFLLANENFSNVGFIAAYDTLGKYLFAGQYRSITGAPDDRIHRVLNDGNNLYIAGTSVDSLDLVFGFNLTFCSVPTDNAVFGYLGTYNNQLPTNGVGIAETKENAVLKIYPNPAENSISVSLPENTSQAFLQLYTTDGRLVLQKNNLSTGNYQLNISHLAQGIYTVVLANNNGPISYSKLVVVK